MELVEPPSMPSQQAVGLRGGAYRSGAGAYRFKKAVSSASLTVRGSSLPGRRVWERRRTISRNEASPRKRRAAPPFALPESAAPKAA